MVNVLMVNVLMMNVLMVNVLMVNVLIVNVLIVNVLIVNVQKKCPEKEGPNAKCPEKMSRKTVPLIRTTTDMKSSRRNPGCLYDAGVQPSISFTTLKRLSPRSSWLSLVM